MNHPKSKTKRGYALALFAVGVALGSAFGQTNSAVNEGLQLSCEQDPNDPDFKIFVLSWYGHTGRTYFIQESDDLVTWHYVPIIEIGTGETIEWVAQGANPPFFLRLKYTDDPYSDDFDSDGISNTDELAAGTDPLKADIDTDGDGVLDFKDARPNDPTIGQLTVTIAYPTDGAVLQ